MTRSSLSPLDKLRLMRAALCCCLWLVSAVAARADGLTFVRDGRARAVIVVAARASSDERLAAEELRLYLRKMSGADVPVSDAPARDLASVRITTRDAARAAGWRGTPPPRDGYTLDRQAGALWIVGDNPRAALDGAYELLEMLGVRWFMPGELGEDYPALRTIRLPARLSPEHAATRTSPPGYEAVSGLIWAGGAGAEEWERRARASKGSRTAFFGHNWENIIPNTPENKRDHPEWFALNRGERINQLCSTNPDVIRITVERAREFFDKNPDALVFSISPNDGERFCECDRCRALDKSYGVTDGSVTDRFVHYANEVLKELGKTHPTKQVGILAYVSHTRPPVSAVPHPNYATMICHTPWEFCHVHALDDPACERNRKFTDYVRGWARVTKNVAVYDYYGHFYVFAPFPVTRNISRDVPFLYRLGVRRFTSETQQHWATQGINFYLASRLLRDPAADPSLILDEYYTRFYGRAAQPMRRYWERFERAMAATATAGDGGYLWLKMYSPSLVEAAARDLDEAERLAAEDSDKVRRRVAFVRMGQRFTDAWTRMRDAAARGDSAGLEAAGAEALRRLDETANTEPQAFWIWLAKDQTQNMMRDLRQGKLMP